MIPQSTFMIVAPIIDARRPELSSLLASMNDRPGMANPSNTLVPFGNFENLHFARFVILEDTTATDFAELGLEVPQYAALLSFMGDFDGPVSDMFAQLANRAEPGLRRIFSCCEGFGASSKLLVWMRTHSHAPTANYVNWIGRTVTQIREEAALRDSLVECVKDNHAAFVRSAPQDVRATLLAHAQTLLSEKKISLGKAPPTPLSWSMRDVLHYAIGPIALLLPWALGVPLLLFHPFASFVISVSIPLGVLAFFVLQRHVPARLALILVLGLGLIPYFLLLPLLLIPAVAVVGGFALVLRHKEKTAAEIIHRPELGHLLELSALEDHDVSNQFNAFGSVKPGVFWRWMFAGLLWAIDYAARHFFGRGHLGRIRTIHFARWVLLDGKKRAFFASNYDGSHEAYMDDFINKAGWGLNVAFGCGVGYPRTKFILKDGCEDELKFKYTQRRHQIPSQSWYRAYPGLTVYDLERNARVRAGFERRTMTDSEVRTWLRDL
jgi:hypothetical protein